MPRVRFQLQGVMSVSNINQLQFIREPSNSRQKHRAMTRLQKVGFAILFDATLLFTELGARAVEHKTHFSFTFCHVTYIFLADHTVFEEKHEGRLAVFTVVQHTHHAICVHAGPCIKLQRDKDNESGTRLENKTVPMSSLALHRFLLGY